MSAAGMQAWAIAQRYKEASNGVIGPGYLRLEKDLNTSKNQYTFDVLQNEGTPTTTEVRLGLTDVFLAYAIQFFIRVIPDSGGTDANGRLLTYPNPVVMSTANASRDAFTIYNGFINTTINNINYLPNWALSKHLYIPESQQRAQATDSPGIAYDQIEGNTNGLAMIETTLTFSGSWKNQVQINLPAAVATLQASARTQMVLMYHGILCNNASNIAGSVEFNGRKY